MNEGLKSIISTAFSVAKLVTDLVEQKGTPQAMTNLQGLSANVPGLFAHYSTVKAEFEGLEKLDSEQDLLEFIMTQFATLGQTDDKKMAIVKASVSLGVGVVLNSYALAKAVKG